MFQFISGSFLFIIVIAVFFLMSAIKILNEYERGVVFRVGRALPKAKGPGHILLIPMIYKLTEEERERRCKVINAEGEFQAAAKMSEAAHVLAQEPMSLTLRYLQTLREIAAEKNSTTLFPIPIDLITPFIKMANRWEKLEALEEDKK